THYIQLGDYSGDKYSAPDGDNKDYLFDATVGLLLVTRSGSAIANIRVVPTTPVRKSLGLYLGVEGGGALNMWVTGSINDFNGFAPYTIEYFTNGKPFGEPVSGGFMPINSFIYPEDLPHLYDNKPDGYTVGSTTGLPLKIQANPTKNVIKVYYTNQYKYSIQYFKDNKSMGAPKSLGTAEYNTIKTFDIASPEATAKLPAGYKVDRVDGITIGTDSAQNIIKVYYVPDSYNYSVQYFKDNVSMGDPTSLGTAEYNSFKTFNTASPTATSKLPVGYKVDRVDGVTIGTDPAQNIIKVYYVPNSYNYGVQYFKDGVSMGAPRLLGKADYNTSKTLEPASPTATAKLPKGYKVDSVVGVTIGTDPAQNIIKVYYVPNSYDYGVQYFNNGVSMGAPVSLGTADYNTTQTLDPASPTATAKLSDLTTGYKVDKVVGVKIGTDPTKNIIKVYYTNKYDYSIQYFKDGESMGSPTLLGKAIYNTFINVKPSSTLVTKKLSELPGYKVDSVVGVTIGTDPAQNIIKVYYVPDSFEYSVQYFKDGASMGNPTSLGKAVYNTFQTLDPASTAVTAMLSDLPGYKVDKVEGVTIGTDSAQNIIKVYYTDQYNYSVEYFKDSVSMGEPESLGTAEYNTSQTLDPASPEATAKLSDLPGYKVDKVEGVTIGTDSSKNIIKVYYVPDSFEYSVQYFKDGVSMGDPTSLGSAVYNTFQTLDAASSTATAKLSEGYKVDKVVGVTIGTDFKLNVIKVYYVTKSEAYTVNYYKSGTTDKVADSKTVNTVRFNDVVNESAVAVTGYTAVNTPETPSSVSYTVKDGANVINFYYTLKPESYTVHYYAAGTTDSVAPDTTGTASFGSSLTVNAAKVAGYTADSDAKTIQSVADGDNVIIFYYTKNIIIKPQPIPQATLVDCKVHYYLNGTTTSVAKDYVTQGVSGSDFTAKPIAISGYTAVSTSSKTITLGDNGNEITFYYTKNVKIVTPAVPTTSNPNTGDNGSTIPFAAALLGFVSAAALKVIRKKSK
ncbi:MAG TPA: hypothetical protein VHO94_03125, partial [Oscillospiraceae bacterium]|nr:hypothetical protein [Oscillospiraceae bacterium]